MMAPVLPTSFFVTGGTLSTSAASYIVRQADTDLYNALLAGEFCYVLNSRQMGKSSLMVRTAEGLKSEGMHVAVLDLTAIGQNLSPEQWYDGLLMRLGRQLGLEDMLEDFYLSNRRLSPFQRWQEALTQVVLVQTTGPIVIFVDEIDVVRSLPFSADEFFTGIRQCYVGRATDSALGRLTFCLLGTATPGELISDTRISPFNIGRRVELQDFTEEEAAPLAIGLGENGHVLLERVLYWTNGHPYLTQRLCRAIAEAGSSATPASQPTTPALVDRLCSDLFFTHSAKEADDNLMFVQNRLLNSRVDTGRLMELYREMREGKRIPDDEADPLASTFKFSGVARTSTGVLMVRNRIYATVFNAEWSRSHMPDAALQRLRMEYRQTLIKAITLFVGILLLPMLTVGLIHGTNTMATRGAAVTVINIITAAMVFYAFGILFRPNSVSLKQVLTLNLFMLAVVAPFTLAVSPIDPYIRLNGDFYYSWKWTVPLLTFLLKDIFLNLIFLPFYWFWHRRIRVDYPPLIHAYLFATGSVLLVYAGASYLEYGLFASYPVSELSYFKVGYVTLYGALIGMAICLGWGIMGYAVGVALRKKAIPVKLFGFALLMRLILDFSFTHAITLVSAISTLVVVVCCSSYLLRNSE